MRPRLEGVGEAKPSQIFLFLVVIAGEAGNHYEKNEFRGGLQALYTSPMLGV